MYTITAVRETERRSSAMAWDPVRRKLLVVLSLMKHTYLFVNHSFVM